MATVNRSVWAPSTTQEVGATLTMSERMGATGIEYVRDNFLTTRYLRDYLNIFCRLSGLRVEGERQPQTQQLRR